MMMDWPAFLRSNHIAFAETGPNIGKDNLGLHCPWCGVDDPSMHLTISLSGAGYRCWRRPREHYGKSPLRLIVALTGCSYSQARQIAGYGPSLPNNFLATITGLIGDNQPTPESTRMLKLPAEFKTFHAPRDGVHSSRLRRQFTNYLYDRGFNKVLVGRLTDRYGVYYCTTGQWAWRIIFTVRKNGALVTWTGRAIGSSEGLRYLTLSKEDGAHGPAGDYLLFYDDLIRTKADTLIICEGPFDALKVSWLGAEHGVCSTCFFTSAPSDRQIDLLHRIVPKFRNRFLMLDSGMAASAMKISADLAALKVRPLELLNGFKDPGELNALSFKKLLQSVL